MKMIIIKFLYYFECDRKLRSLRDHNLVSLVHWSVKFMHICRSYCSVKA